MNKHKVSLRVVIPIILSVLIFGAAKGESNTQPVSPSQLFPAALQDGAPVSPPIDIRTNQRDSIDPSAAYNSSNFEFLVIWGETIKAGKETAVYGRRLNRDGDPLGSAFPIMSAADKIYNFPVAVYVPKHNKYWITLYEQKSDKWDIWAKSIDRFGETEYQFLLSTGIYAGPPAMAYNSQKDQVMVVYEKVTSGSESVIEAVCYQAQFGTDCGLDEIAAAPGKFFRQPDVACSPLVGECLVGYNKMSQSGTDSHVYSKICKPDLSWCSAEMDITNRSYPPQFNTALASGPGEYLVVWRDSYDNGTDVLYARRVGDGGSLKPIIPLTPESKGLIFPPTAAYGDSGHYLVTPFEEEDVMGRFIRSGTNEPEGDLFYITQTKVMPNSLDVTCGEFSPCLVVYSESKAGEDSDIRARLVGHWRRIYIPASLRD